MSVIETSQRFFRTGTLRLRFRGGSLQLAEWKLYLRLRPSVFNKPGPALSHTLLRAAWSLTGRSLLRQTPRQTCRGPAALSGHTAETPGHCRYVHVFPLIHHVVLWWKLLSLILLSWCIFWSCFITWDCKRSVHARCLLALTRRHHFWAPLKY